MIQRRGFMVLLGLSASTAYAAAPSDPAQPIAQLNAGLLQIMHAGRAVDFAKRVAILRPRVEDAFDLSLILQNSVGPSRWTSMTDAQKTALMDVFAQFTIASYVANFDSFSGEQFIIASDLRRVGNDVVVQTRIVGNSGDPTRLDYVMRETNGWRVVDILLDGSISRVAVTRSDFRSLLAAGGADALIGSLRGKVESLKVGVVH